MKVDRVPLQLFLIWSGVERSLTRILAGFGFANLFLQGLFRKRHLLAVVPLFAAASLTHGQFSGEFTQRGLEAQQAARAEMQRQQAALEAAAAVPTPRDAKGRPDLNGVWYTDNYFAGSTSERINGVVSIVTAEYATAGSSVRGLPADMPKYKPELIAQVDYNDRNQPAMDPAFHCDLPGVPRMGPPHQIVTADSSREVVFLYTTSGGDTFRVIPTDGRKHREGIDPTYNGDAIGWWEGDTLVVDSRNFVTHTWFGGRGYFHSDQMRVVERITREGNTLLWSATVYDPEVLLEPWTTEQRVALNNEMPLLEALPCMEVSFEHLHNMSNHGRGDDLEGLGLATEGD